MVYIFFANLHMKCDFADSRRYLVANDLHYGLRKKLWNGDGKSKHLKASSFPKKLVLIED